MKALGEVSMILKVHFTLGILEWFRLGWLRADSTGYGRCLRWWGQTIRPNPLFMDGIFELNPVSFILEFVCSLSLGNYHCIIYWKATCCFREYIKESVTWLSEFSDKYAVFCYFSKAKRDKLNLSIATHILKTVLNCGSITFIILLNYKSKCNFILI